MKESGLKFTPLHGFHLNQKAKMVPFAGYEMPVQYKDGIIAEHNWTRQNAGLFDVSHMGLIKISGTNATKALERILPMDCETLKEGQQKYSYLLNENGGIIDDLMVTKYDGFYIIVANASRKDTDFAIIKEAAEKETNVNAEMLAGYALIAVQGPKAREVLGELNPAFQELSFMKAKQLSLMGTDCFVSCSGYTGEDGFEIAIPADVAEALVETLLQSQFVRPIGLGARDTLRLEAGLCLYGNDISEDISPAEAGITFAISKKRLEKRDFAGADKIYAQMSNGVNIRLVGIEISSPIPARHEDEVFKEGTDEKIGEITSGSFSPTLKRPIALALVDDAYSEAGTTVCVKVRDNMVKATVVKLPFVAHNYHKISSKGEKI